MKAASIKSGIMNLLGFHQKAQTTGSRKTRGPQTHIIILDGTLCSLEEGRETNAGLTYRLLQEAGDDVSLFYESGIQWNDFRSTRDVITGRGINRQIRRAYSFLSSRYKPGDRIFLFGYSRGAFAVRSLAGVIDQVGLLKAEHSMQRNIRQAYRHYEIDPDSVASKAFRRAYCHDEVEIEMVGVWDTVKALGLRLPVLWTLTEKEHEFHNHRLGPSIKRGFQALAIHETRAAFTPILWEHDPNWKGHLEQVWFKGTHGDIGGQLGGFEDCRPLSNIPFTWMLTKAEDAGLPLPDNWKRRFPTDPNAPSVGTWRHYGKLFLLRGRRRIPDDSTMRIHDSALS